MLYLDSKHTFQRWTFHQMPFFLPFTSCMSGCASSVVFILVGMVVEYQLTGEPLPNGGVEQISRN